MCGKGDGEFNFLKDYSFKLYSGINVEFRKGL